jgi:hypothetical protein
LQWLIVCAGYIVDGVVVVVVVIVVLPSAVADTQEVRAYM